MQPELLRNPAQPVAVPVGAGKKALNVASDFLFDGRDRTVGRLVFHYRITGFIIRSL